MKKALIGPCGGESARARPAATQSLFIQEGPGEDPAHLVALCHVDHPYLTRPHPTQRLFRPRQVLFFDTSELNQRH